MSIAVVCVVAALLVGVPAGPATAAGPYTSYAISGDADDVIVGNAGFTGATIQLDGDEKNISGGVGRFILWMAAPPDGRLEAGRTYDISGPPGRARGAGFSLSGGSGSYCSDEVGTFTFSELTFDADGRLDTLSVTFTVQCAGGTGRAYGSIALRAASPAPPVPPALRLDIPTKRVDYGATVGAKARVSAGAPGTVVSLYRRTSGGVEELISQTAADAAGLVTASLRLEETTTVIARIYGGGAFPDRVVSETVPVRGKLVTKVVGRARTRGGTHLVPVTQAAVVGARLLPDHVGDCIKFRLELRVRGSWGFPTASRCLKLNDRSAAAVRLPGDRRLLGIPVRVRTQWKGDDRNSPTKSRWVYLRFVR